MEMENHLLDTVSILAVNEMGQVDVKAVKG